MLCARYIVTLLVIACGVQAQSTWDIAVALNNQIELLHSNGTLIDSTVKWNSEWKALTFDIVRQKFIVSERDSLNDSISTVYLSKETEVTPIVTELPDDVQGLAVDPIEDILYWTDRKNQAINYINLSSTDPEPQVLFKNVQPWGITIDVCRRYVYWTNYNIHQSTIERAYLNGSNRNVLFDSDLLQPSGIAVDYKTDRLYWADMRAGIYFRIESSTLDGEERATVFEGVHVRPFGIAVDNSFVYWTDNSNYAVWRMLKTQGQNSSPEKIREFNERPFGIVANDMQSIRNYPDCKEIERSVEKSDGQSVEKYVGAQKEEEEEEYQATDPNPSSIQCLNGGRLIGKTCLCATGYSGTRCETENCHNYCVRGSCHLSLQGSPFCRCYTGFRGARCEVEACADFCLNGGRCIPQGDSRPRCDCSGRFTGDRCQDSTSFQDMCQMYCRDKVADDDTYLFSNEEELVCRCEKGKFVVTKSNLTAPSLYSEASPFYGRNFLEKVSTDGDFLALVLSMAALIIANIAFLVYYFSTRYKRPIITKRVIVNRNITPRNVTPLTYRPQATTEQCEVTIENCCNMNVCETPCFEPPSLRGKKRDDKKVLLTEIESGEESY